MSMPFYVSPEQLMKDRADYARKGIARGRSVVVLQYDDGIAFATENPSRALHKISEIYDRIALRGRRQVQRVREPAGGRRALRRPARLLLRPRGRHRPRPGQRLRADARHGRSPRSPSRSRSRSSSPRSGATPAGDQIYRLSYDGSVTDEHGYVVMGGQAERLGGLLARGVARRADAARGARARGADARRAGGGRRRAAHDPGARSSRSRCWTGRVRAGRSDGWPVRCWRTCWTQTDRAISTGRRGSTSERGEHERWTGGSSASRRSTASRARPTDGRGLSADEVARYLFRKVVAWGRSSNVFLRNGSRLYLDVGSHPEYATAECDDVRQLVTHDRAGERILEGLVADAQQRLEHEGAAGHDPPVQEQHRLGGQLLRLPRELPRAPAGRLLPARPTCWCRSSSRARSSRARARCSPRPRGRGVLPVAARGPHLGGGLERDHPVAADHQHARRAARRRRALPPPARDRRATRRCPRRRRCSRSARPTCCCG